MDFYWVKTPGWLKLLFPKELVWRMPEEEKPAVYLTFDDGPHPVATPFVLDCLKRFDAHATFFCIGKNVELYPEVYHRLETEGHTVGNHTHNHLNGWKTAKSAYVQNIEQAAGVIDGRLFRPPYGRIRAAQARALLGAMQPWRIYMWDILSGDFDRTLSPQQCLDNVIENISPGSIVIFHDSEKAYPRMSYALPKLLEYCKDRGWALKALPK